MASKNYRNDILTRSKYHSEILTRSKYCCDNLYWPKYLEDNLSGSKSCYDILARPKYHYDISYRYRHFVQDKMSLQLSSLFGLTATPRALGVVVRPKRYKKSQWYFVRKKILQWLLVQYKLSLSMQCLNDFLSGTRYRSDKLYWTKSRCNILSWT